MVFVSAMSNDVFLGDIRRMLSPLDTPHVALRIALIQYFRLRSVKHAT